MKMEMSKYKNLINDVSESQRKIANAWIMKYDHDQLYEINMGVLMGFDLDQINIYARPEFNYIIMRFLKDCIIHNMDGDKLKFIANPDFIYPQMIAIKEGFDNGLTIDEVKEYAIKELTCNEMHDKMNAILDRKRRE